ncbi:gliding motility-associated C-terminal domain-containing protein, partial [bacterium]|nr:gliding motility-associated C-terminal domain-containing protein [bacterium]
PYPNTNPPPDVRQASSPICVYLGGLFGSAGAGEYSTIISFDLYHLAPQEVPVISHTPIQRIGIMGNKTVFEAKITDDKSVESATIHYKIGKSGKWQSAGMSLQGSPVEKIATYVLPPQAVTGPCEISYWLEARDGEDNIGRWKDGYSPQIIEVTQSIAEIVGPEGGTAILPDGNPEDGEVMVDIPEGALSKETKITIEQITDLSRVPGYSEGWDWEPVAIYNFTEEGTRFKKPVTMNLLYFDLDNNGKPEDWKGKEMEFNESQLACYWWDGITWRPVGGKVDSDSNIATIKVNHFSYYGLFKARPMGISEYRPEERIITPAYVDGKNDVAYFSGLSGQNTTIRIYDITGKKIRTIDGEPYEWDGRDEDGNIVESGIYIYQFKADVDGKKRLVSGTIAVAK